MSRRVQEGIEIEVPHILVLDDDDGVRLLLCRILRDEQYNPYPVESVARAFAALAERSFDGYLLDYRLQDGTGLEVAQKVRQQGSSAPITLITGYSSDVIAAEARGLDIFQIIEKPFTRQAICSTIKMAFERVSEARGDTTYQEPASVLSDKQRAEKPPFGHGPEGCDENRVIYGTGH